MKLESHGIGLHRPAGQPLQQVVMGAVIYHVPHQPLAGIARGVDDDFNDAGHFAALLGYRHVMAALADRPRGQSPRHPAFCLRFAA